MRVVVLGAGVAGVTTAWYLAEAGAEVTVMDRGAEPAAETSHANGGHISTQSAAPWVGPDGLREFMTMRLRRERTTQVLHVSDPGRLAWFVAALFASRPAAFRSARATLRRLAAYSRENLYALLKDQSLDIALEDSGVLAVYRTRRAFRRACRAARRSEDVRIMAGAEIAVTEPAFVHARIRPAGAIHYLGDSTGDCHRFCLELAGRAQRLGTRFRFGAVVRGLDIQSGQLRAVRTTDGRVPADACVVALGAEAASFLKPYGVHLPILPLRGYTLSAPIRARRMAPGRFIDAERRVVFARLENTFRAAGMADFAGSSREIPASRAAVLERISREWYPSLQEPIYWSCLRPMTPDGPPVLGASGISGLWLNTGLGPLGWTLGCGAARIVADSVLGRRPAISLEGLTRERFS